MPLMETFVLLIPMQVCDQNLLLLGDSAFLTMLKTSCCPSLLINSLLRARRRTIGNSFDWSVLKFHPMLG